MEEVLSYAPLLRKGTIATVELTLASAVLVLAISFVIGLSRISMFRYVRVAATIYLEFFRGTSALVQLFFMYYVLPLWGVVFAPLTAGILACGCRLTLEPFLVILVIYFVIASILVSAVKYIERRFTKGRQTILASSS